MNFLKKYKRVALLVASLSLVFVLAGCGVKYNKDVDGKIITDEVTGARSVANLIDQDVKISELLSDGNLYDGLLVVPISKFITFLGEMMGYGIAIIVSTIVIRAAAFPITMKSTQNAKKMQEIQPKVEKIRNKYRGKDNDKEAQMRMNQEVMALYQKENVSMVKGCISPFITLPLFFAYFSAIYRTPGILNPEETFLGINLATTPKFAIASGDYLVIVLVVFVIAAQFFSMKVSTAGQGNDQTKNMAYYMTAMMAFIIFTIPAGVVLYWGTGSLIMIAQNYIVKGKKTDK